MGGGPGGSGGRPGGGGGHQTGGGGETTAAIEFVGSACAVSCWVSRKEGFEELRLCGVVLGVTTCDDEED